MKKTKTQKSSRKTPLQRALRVLIKTLKEDEGYKMSWTANIAVQFQDEFYRNHRNHGVHEISNRAAENFINLLINLDKE